MKAARNSSIPKSHSARRAEPAKTSLANNVRPSALTTTPSFVSFIWMLEVIVACFVVLFFYAFVQYFSTWPKGCLRAVACVSGCSPLVLGDLYPVRAARICYRLLLKTQSCFLGLLGAAFCAPRAAAQHFVLGSSERVCVKPAAPRDAPLRRRAQPRSFRAMRRSNAFWTSRARLRTCLVLITA